MTHITARLIAIEFIPSRSLYLRPALASLANANHTSTEVHEGSVTRYRAEYSVENLAEAVGLLETVRGWRGTRVWVAGIMRQVYSVLPTFYCLLRWQQLSESDRESYCRRHDLKGRVISPCKRLPYDYTNTAERDERLLMRQVRADLVRHDAEWCPGLVPQEPAESPKAALLKP